MLGYSHTLYFLFLNSANLATFFLLGLTFFSFLNLRFFKDSYYFIFLTFLAYLFAELLINYFMNSVNNNWTQHLYSIIACILPSIFYVKSLRIKKLNIVVITIIIIYCLSSITQISYNLITQSSIESPYLFTLKNILSVVLAVILHSKLTKSPKVKAMKNEPAFWFNIGFLFANVANLILYPIYKIVTPISDNLAFIFGILINISDPITYTLWAIGVYKLRTQPFRPVASLWP
jgi:hypothetical protein